MRFGNDKRKILDYGIALEWRDKHLFVAETGKAAFSKAIDAIYQARYDEPMPPHELDDATAAPVALGVPAPGVRVLVDRTPEGGAAGVVSGYKLLFDNHGNQSVAMLVAVGVETLEVEAGSAFERIPPIPIFNRVQVAP